MSNSDYPFYIIYQVYWIYTVAFIKSIYENHNGISNVGYDTICKSISKQKALMNRTVKYLHKNYVASNWDEDLVKPNLLDPGQRNERRLAG